MHFICPQELLEIQILWPKAGSVEGTVGFQIDHGRHALFGWRPLSFYLGAYSYWRRLRSMLEDSSSCHGGHKLLGFRTSWQGSCVDRHHMKSIHSNLTILLPTELSLVMEADRGSARLRRLQAVE